MLEEAIKTVMRSAMCCGDVQAIRIIHTMGTTRIDNSLILGFQMKDNYLTIFLKREENVKYRIDLIEEIGVM